MSPEKAIPLLRVSDVARSAAWYQDAMGFNVDAFPNSERPIFAILTLGSTELMLRRSEFGRDPHWEDWDVRIPLREGLRELHTELAGRGMVTRSLERMPYCDVEFDVRDPDGYVICFSQPLGDDDDLPLGSER